MKKTIIGISIVTSLLIFNGCVNNNINSTESTYKSSEKISLEKKRKISEILTELSGLDKKIYHFSGDDLEIGGHKNLKIDSFDSFNSVLKSLMNKELVITKNKMFADLPKIVELRDIQTKSALDDIQVGSTANLLPSVFLKNISSYASDWKIDFKNGTKNEINDNAINNYSGTAKNFLDFYAKSNNLYIDYDFNAKSISLSKYKQKNFNLKQNDTNENGKIKVVRIVDKNSLENSFDNTSLNLQGENVDLKKALLSVSKITGFSVIYKNLENGSGSSASSGASGGATMSSGLSSTEKVDDEFVSKLISFKSGTISNFLKYTEIALNVYIDIDYKEKIITISKFKSKSIPLLINNREIQKNKMASAAEGAEGLTDGNTDSEGLGGVTSKFNYGVFSELEKSFDTILKTSDSRNNVKIDYATGAVNINATSDVMRQITEKVETFNDSYRKQVEIELTTLEIIVNNNLDLGIDVEGQQTNGANSIISTISTALTGETLPSATFSRNGDKATVKSLKDIGYVSKVTSQTYKARNHTPYVIKSTDVTNYVENMTSTPIQTGTTNTVTQSTETSKLSVGLSAVVLPKIVGDEISLYINPASTRLNSMTKEKYSTLEVNIPSVNISIVENELLVRSGDKVVIGSHTIFEDSDTYKGIIPLEDFIVGGNSSKKLVKKIIVYVLTAKAY